MKYILFVDQFNATNSVMAEGWFNRYARGMHKASSCGVTPAEWTDAQATQAMYQVGIEIGHKLPHRFDAMRAARADLVIWLGASMDLAIQVPVRVWSLEEFAHPLPHQVLGLREQIRQRVLELVQELEQEPTHPKFTDREWHIAIEGLLAM